MLEIHDDIEIILPKRDVIPSIPSSRRIIIFMDQLFASLRLPLPPLITEFLSTMEAPTGQFPPTFWIIFLSCYILCKEHGRELTLVEFQALYYLNLGWRLVHHQVI